MMRKYPKWVRTWIIAQGGLSDQLATMTYDYANKFMRTCSLQLRADHSTECQPPEPWPPL